jgi:rRNA maturation protein Rpf1
MIVSHFPHGPTVYFTLNNVLLRHDVAAYRDSTVSEQYPHLIFENFSSVLGGRVQDVLKHLFPVPKPEATRVMTFSNADDFISFRYARYSARSDRLLSEFRRHHVFVKIPKSVQLAEVGPRFEMKRACISISGLPPLIVPHPQRTRSGSARSNRSRPSANGCSPTTRARPKSAGFCPFPGPARA